MNLEEAAKETKNFIKAEAKLAGVEPEVIIEELEGEVGKAEFVESTR